MFLEIIDRLLRRSSALISLAFWLLLTSSLLLTYSTPAQDVNNYDDTSKTSQAPVGVVPQKDSKENNEARASEALDLIRSWSIRFGSDIFYGTQEATCLRALRGQFDPAKSDPARRGNYKASIVSIDWTRTHADIVKTISNTMGWHKSAVEAIASASESLAAKHTNVYDEKNHFDYTDVHRLLDIDEIQDMESNGLDVNINEMDNSTVTNENYPETGPTDEQDPAGRQQPEATENGEQLGQPSALVAANPSTIEQSPPPSSSLDQTTEWQTPLRYLKLSRHPNFDVPINTEESAVHVPVHIYPGDPTVMNGIAWSQELTKVFRDNFVNNPKLTNQYFASQTGFMRLFPARKWQIPRTDPDLYDARVRPWYVAAASSRKDVIMLVDSSGSMTGSRRDIAKGVVFEILDTLTDNDHFLVLKFNDAVQQVGVPSCESMRVDQDKTSSGRVPLKNTMFMQQDQPSGGVGGAISVEGASQTNDNGTDIDSLYLLPATGRNVRHIKSNFTIPTSGIANFGRALVTAFEVLRKYQDTKRLGSQCNQAIMLITDGSPSDFAEIFDRYNYPNAPVRVFTYLIGREAADGTHTKMMACHNRGFYTHVINLAEVRETIQQYIPVMARPLVLNRTHPITWTPAYAELTYQVLTDWIWESRRREKARNLLASNGRTVSSPSPGGGYVPDIRVTIDNAAGQTGPGTYSTDELSNGAEASLDSELDALDLFGYESNPDCFWETRGNDLLTTVVQPVYDTKNESLIVEKYLNKNIWFKKTTSMRTANLLGVAAADMKINDIIGLAPSHKLGSNGYAVMLTNNGLVMHHPDLRSILEPFTNDPAEKNSRILKPFFSSLDFIHLEHILNHETDDADFLALRREAVAGLTGWRELLTKRTIDCQRRVQTRRQSFYYKPLQHFPFSFLIAIPQPYGSHRVEAQVEVKSSGLPEKLTTYFTTSDYDLWTVHPHYQYCEGPSNNTVTTLLDMFQRIEEAKLNDIQWRVAESSKPPVFLPDKIICDKDLVQSLLYDAVATFGFAETCGPPSADADPLNLLLALLPRSTLSSMFGIRFSFVSTRSGLTRVRQYDADDMVIKKEALAFAKKHARAIDETFYSRTVDYNMLVNESAVLVQVPFNTHLKIAELLAVHEGEHPDDDEEPLSGDSGETSSSSPADVGGQTSSSSSRLRVKDMNLMEKLEILTNSSLHVITTQSIIVNEGAQRAVAGVAGAFYDYASFVMRFLNSTRQIEGSRTIKKPATCFGDNPTDESCDTLKAVKCGLSNDTIDCLLVDNNGYILASEDLDFIGRHLKAYEPTIMSRLVRAGVFHEINVTDYQSICMRHGEDKSPNAGSPVGKSQLSSSSPSRSSITINSLGVTTMLGSIIKNALLVARHTWTILATLANLLIGHTCGHSYESNQIKQQQQSLQPMLALISSKTYLRPCERILTRYETRPGIFNSDTPEYFETQCNCSAWFVYEQVPKTNLIMLIVDTTPACRHGCDQAPQLTPETVDDSLNTRYNIISTSEEKVCSMLERESKLYTKRLDSCFANHPEEEQIKLCGGASKSTPISILLTILMLILSHLPKI